MVAGPIFIDRKRVNRLAMTSEGIVVVGYTDDELSQAWLQEFDFDLIPGDESAVSSTEVESTAQVVSYGELGQRVVGGYSYNGGLETGWNWLWVPPFELDSAYVSLPEFIGLRDIVMDDDGEVFVAGGANEGIGLSSYGLDGQQHWTSMETWNQSDSANNIADLSLHEGSLFGVGLAWSPDNSTWKNATWMGEFGQMGELARALELANCPPTVPVSIAATQDGFVVSGAVYPNGDTAIADGWVMQFDHEWNHDWTVVFHSDGKTIVAGASAGTEPGTVVVAGTHFAPGMPPPTTRAWAAMIDATP